VKKIDVAVFDAIRAVQDGNFESGSDRVFNVKSEGVGIGKISAEGEQYMQDLEKVQQQLAAGEIDVPNTVV
jgi:basic membrane lipoprotein Med (substrate-binding protein (PBP1-ABC) superfamily)